MKKYSTEDGCIMENNNTETDIDLKEIAFVLLDKIWLIIASTVLVGLIALLITKTIVTPMYTSDTSMYVMNKDSGGSITSSDIQVSTYLTNDYLNLVKSRTVLEKVISNLNLDMTVNELKGRITVTAPTNTRIIQIAVTDEDAFRAKKIADTVAEYSSARIVEIMNTEQVNIYDPANVPTRPSSPSTVRNVLIGALVGFILSVAVVIIRFILDDSVKTEDDIEKYLGCPMLAAIPYAEILDDSTAKKKKNRKKKGK